jgi:hypothetical protein
MRQLQGSLRLTTKDIAGADAQANRATLRFLKISVPTAWPAAKAAAAGETMPHTAPPFTSFHASKESSWQSWPWSMSSLAMEAGQLPTFDDHSLRRQSK